MKSARANQEIVTDASLWLNAVLPRHASHSLASQLIPDGIAGDVVFLVPTWWEAETDSALRSMVAAKALTLEAAERAQQILDAAPIVKLYEPTLRSQARRIADILKQIKVYDATYVALAVARNCDFWTADKRLFNTVQNEGRGAFPVSLLEGYAGELRKHTGHDL